MLIKILIACILSGILYRFGGQGKPFNTRYRDLGCPLVALMLLWLMKGVVLSYWWVYLSFFILSWGALSSYWDDIFGYDNFYAHGFGCGIAAIPLFWCGVSLWIILARLIICTVGMGLWSKFIKKDVPQEIGRGVLFIL